MITFDEALHIDELRALPFKITEQPVTDVTEYALVKAREISKLLLKEVIGLRLIWYLELDERAVLGDALADVTVSWTWAKANCRFIEKMSSVKMRFVDVGFIDLNYNMPSIYPS